MLLAKKAHLSPLPAPTLNVKWQLNITATVCPHRIEVTHRPVSVLFEPHKCDAWKHWNESYIYVYLFSLLPKLRVGKKNTGSEMDEEEMMISESENSNESWTTEEFSSEFIMRYGSRWFTPPHLLHLLHSNGMRILDLIELFLSVLWLRSYYYF